MKTATTKEPNYRDPSQRADTGGRFYFIRALAKEFRYLHGEHRRGNETALRQCAILAHAIAKAASHDTGEHCYMDTSDRLKTWTAVWVNIRECDSVDGFTGHVVVNAHGCISILDYEWPHGHEPII